MNEVIQWHSVAESKPKAGQVCLLSFPDGTEQGYLDKSNVWRWLDNMRISSPPKYWAAMPKGPKEAGK